MTLSNVDLLTFWYFRQNLGREEKNEKSKIYDK